MHKLELLLSLICIRFYFTRGDYFGPVCNKREYNSIETRDACDSDYLISNGLIKSIKIEETVNGFLIKWKPLDRVYYDMTVYPDFSGGSFVIPGTNFNDDTSRMYFYYSDNVDVQWRAIDSLDFSYRVLNSNRTEFKFYTYVRCNDTRIARSNTITKKFENFEQVFVNYTEPTTDSSFSNVIIPTIEVGSTCSKYMNKHPVKQIVMSNRRTKLNSNINIVFWDHLEYCSLDEVNSIFNSTFWGSGLQDNFPSRKNNVFIYYDITSKAYLFTTLSNYSIEFCPWASQETYEIVSFFKCENKCFKSKTEIIGKNNFAYNYEDEDIPTTTKTTTTTTELENISPFGCKPSFILILNNLILITWYGLR